MKPTQPKLRLIYLPFLLVVIGFLVAFTFLNWLLLIKLHAFSLNEDITNFWGPIVLAWIPALIWLQPRIKLLSLKSKRGDAPFFYLFMAAAAIAAPTCVAQPWLQTSTGKLTRLYDIRQITQSEPTKYYTLNKFYIDRAHAGVKTRFIVSGKNSETFNMNLYIALPILGLPGDTANSTCVAWYGVKYHHSIGNRLSQEEKQREYEVFLNQSQADFNMKNLTEFMYLDRAGNTDDYKGWLGAIKNNKNFDNTATTVLLPVNEPFEKRNGNKFAWIFGSFAIGAGIWLIMVLIPKLDETSLKKFGSKTPAKSDDKNRAGNFLIPREGFFATPIIAELNVLIFIIMVLAGLGVISFEASDLLAWGADYRPAVSQGQWWRVITSMFLHGGLMHLVSNMYGLILVGLFLEPVLGRAKYALIYLGTGIFASIASLWWHPATVSVGASGAIFGLYGTFLALILTKVYPKQFSKSFLPLTLIFIGYNILMGLMGGVDNAAHLGGLVSGFIIGIFLSGSLKPQTKVPTV
jgi:rhomboid protease GluP